MKRFFPWSALFCAALFSLTAQAAPSVTTSLDRPSMTVGESATLQLKITGGEDVQAPNYPSQPNFAVTYQNAENRYMNINGRASSFMVLNYAVTASQPGTYTIPAVQVIVDNTALATQPLSINVTKAEGAIGTGPAFVRILVAKTNVFIGELIPIQIKVYGLAIDQLQVPTLKSDGFTVGASGQNTQSREQFGNNIYGVYTFPMTVAAAKAGNLSLGPAEAPMVIRVLARNSFEQIFGGQQRQFNAVSEPVMIHVNPLPKENVPASFNGAVGNFSMTARASPTAVAVGDPITLQIVVKGRGSFDTVKLPDFGWKDFTFYPPNSTVTNLDALGVQAIKAFDQVVSPQRAGISAIPPIEFSFFDPEQRAYKTITRPAMPITVKATGAGLAQPTVVAEHTANEPQRSVSDIVHIKPTLGQMVTLGPPLPFRPWFVVLQLLPIGLWGGAVFWRKQTDRLANDPKLRRKREVARVVERGLTEARDAARQNESEKFFATTFRLLQEQVGERLDMPAAAITEAVVDEQLPKHGVNGDLLAKLRELFEACNQARYARASVAGMEALIPKLESALREVQQLPERAGGAA